MNGRVKEGEGKKEGKEERGREGGKKRETEMKGS